MPEPDLIELFVEPLAIRGMLAVSGERFDQAALVEWSTRQGVAADWRSAQS